MTQLVAGRFPRSFAWILLGVVVLGTFAALAYEGAAWEEVWMYTVQVSADSNVSWTVTAPAPFGSPWPVWEKSHNVGRITAVDMGPINPPPLGGPHGYTYNISGHGEGAMWFRFTDFALTFGDPDGAFPDGVLVFLYHVNLTSASVARESTNGTSAILFSGTTFELFTRADRQVLCPGLSFSGSLQEGWNNLTLVPDLCTASGSVVPLAMVSVPFLVAGLICTYVGVQQGRRFRWEK